VKTNLSRDVNPFAGIVQGGRVFQSDALTKEPVVELVPDGVASVRIAYRETPTIVVPVSENAFLFTPPPPTPRVKAALRKRPKPRIVVIKHAITMAEFRRIASRRIASPWDKILGETHLTRIEWLNRAGLLVRALSPPANESNSATSVGDLRAPLEGATSIKPSRAPHS
jgi:hypothetical protein